MSGLFSKPSLPAPAAPSPADAARKEQDRRKRLAGARGRGSTILTPLAGTFDNKKTLLGQ